jgi:tetratricopeptide (TPR) repeat protein
MQNELPLEISALRGFNELLARFHREARIGDLWQQAQPSFDALIAENQAAVSQALLESNAYLRNPTSGSNSGTFFVLFDTLAGPNQVHTRTIENRRYFVITPSEEFPLERLRIAYLQYLLDPMVWRHKEEIEKKRPLEDYALGSALLSDQYKQDFVLLMTRCLANAVSVRSQRMPEAERERRVQRYLEEGFIFTPYFYEQLENYEKQEASLRIYVGDLIKEIDVYAENARLDKVTFAETREAKVVREAQVVELSEAELRLEKAEELLYVAKDVEKAKPLYIEISQDSTNRRFQARAYFALGRIAVLENDPESAEQLFGRVLELEPDTATESWTTIYLGRLAHVAGDNKLASQYLERALKIEGISVNARKAAQKALREINN